MSSLLLSRRLKIALAALLPLYLSGCSNNSIPTPTPTPSNPFANVVFIGDSLTAGFQNGSLLDTQQPNGYANLVAVQAKAAITLPLIAPPGAPAVLKLLSTSFPPVVMAESGTTTGRDNPTQQPTDLAVPGHMLHDVINYAPPVLATSDEDLITDLVLGFPIGNTKPQLAEAVALKPSTIFVWAGNDDALQADESGTPTTMTSISSFTTDFTQLMTTLKSQTTANIVVANIPDVTAIPYMTPAATIISEVAALTGLPAVAVGPALGISSGDLVNASGLAAIEAQLKTIAGGGAPTPLPGSDVLTAAEIVTVQSTIASYNQVIQQQATAVGATLVDMHAYFATLSAGVTINSYNATDTFLGGLFGLDGIHPTNTGYALLANQFIAALNTKFMLSIAAVNVSQVAAADPYFGPNIKPAFVTAIPVTAALRSDELITGFKQTTLGSNR
jgi:phospholipase/lecithinase/hemolysin